MLHNPTVLPKTFNILQKKTREFEKLEIGKKIFRNFKVNKNKTNLENKQHFWALSVKNLHASKIFDF